MTSGFAMRFRLHRSLWNVASLTWCLAINSQRRTARSSILGHAWWIIEPGLQIALYFLSFGIVLQTGTKNYLAMLICGVVTWRFFSQAVSLGATSLLQNQAFLRSFRVSSVVFPVSACMDAALRVTPMAVVMLGYGAISSGVSWLWLWLPFIAIVQAMLVLAVVIHLSWVTVYVPDLNQMLEVGLRAGLFLSGVFYVASELGTRGELLLAINPEALIIQAVRDVLIIRSAPNFLSLTLAGLVSALAIVAGFAIHRSKAGKLPALLMN